MHPNGRKVHMTKKNPRNATIEALRLLAVFGIAIFHTFQWTFENICMGTPGFESIAAFPYSGILGFINLLGCWANEVFFMISGFFLIPSAVHMLEQGDGVTAIAQKSIKRVIRIALTTLFYCLVCLLISEYIYPLPGISLHEVGWLTLGIEFIWVYAASVLLVPFIASAHNRLGLKRATMVMATMVLATFGINIYIALTSVTSIASTISWRKLMSAVTYLVAFIAAGEMQFILKRYDKVSTAKKSKLVLTGLIAAAVTIELLLSANSQYAVLRIFSYKSTSVISFILAAASVAAAALHQPRREASTTDKAITSLAAGTLAFYAVQSFTCNVWRPIFDNAIYTTATVTQTGAPRPTDAILLGVFLSLCLALTLLIMDIVRRAVVDAVKAHMNS